MVRPKSPQKRYLDYDINQYPIVRIQFWISIFVLPLTWQDFTQRHFRDGEVAHEPRLVRCWTIQVIGSQGTMWTMLAFAKYPPARLPGDFAGQRIIRPEGQVLCLSLIFLQPEGDLAKAESHSVSKGKWSYL